MANRRYPTEDVDVARQSYLTPRQVLLCSIPVVLGWFAYPKVLDHLNTSSLFTGSIDLEEWHHSNTYEHTDFSVDELLALKNAKNLSISVVLPARNEGDTVGPIVEMVRSNLMNPDIGILVDQLLVIDSDSTDNTSEVATEAGALVHKKADILPAAGDNPGKGETLWKSLAVAVGDIIVWLDADVTGSGPHFVTGLLGPLLKDDDLIYSKGFYERPLVRGGAVQPGEGGRVTELSVKPLLKHLYPEFTGFYQPLSGEYAIRRNVALELPFFINYGVEMGLLIDISRKYGLDRIAQVNLNSRIHKNRGLKHLSLMANQVVSVMVKRAGLIRDELAAEFAVERPPIKQFL